MFHVEHQAADRYVDATSIVDACATVGITVTHTQAELLAQHAGRVDEADRQLNLTGRRSIDEILWLDIVDSLAYLPLVGELRQPVVDIGSGQGFPGIPLAACTGLVTTLCEATKKKAGFLRGVVGELHLVADVYAGRAEDLARDRPETYGTAVARAVTSTAALVELAAPLLCTGGLLLALRGRVDEADLSAADRTAAICGMERSGRWTYSLPALADSRCVVAYERVGPSVVKLPRRPGMAQKRPLG